MQGDWPNSIADAASQDESRNTVLCFKLPPGTKHTLYAQPGALLGSYRLDNGNVPNIRTIDIRMLNFHPRLGVRQGRSSIEDEKVPFDLLSRRQSWAVGA